MELDGLGRHRDLKTIIMVGPCYASVLAGLSADLPSSHLLDDCGVYGKASGGVCVMCRWPAPDVTEQPV